MNGAPPPPEPTPAERAVLQTAAVAEKQITTVAQSRRYDFITDAVRAFLAAVVIVSTILMMFRQIPITDAWWAIAGAVVAFYFVQRAAASPSG
jgi:hypothetical protein